MRRKGKLERRLERDRPKPRNEFVAALARRITPEATRTHSRWRPVLVGGFTALLVLAFTVTGGIGYAANAVQHGTSAVTSLVTKPLEVGNPGKPDKPDKPNKPQQSEQSGGAQSQGAETQSQGAGGGAQSQGADAQSQGGGDKITICHIPPGNPDNPQTITIDESAWPDPHQKHGDTLGPCDDVSPPDDCMNNRRGFSLPDAARALATRST